VRPNRELLLRGRADRLVADVLWLAISGRLRSLLYPSTALGA